MESRTWGHQLGLAGGNVEFSGAIEWQRRRFLKDRRCFSTNIVILQLIEPAKLAMDPPLAFERP